jgi:hypothetical protein
MEAVRATAHFYSLRNAMGSLARRDWFDFALKLYAWREARRFRRIARPFLRQLRSTVLRHTEAVRQLIPEGAANRVVLPTLGLPDQYNRFLKEFLRGLRLNPVEVPVAITRYQEQLASLRSRASVVLLPLLEEGQEMIQGLQKAGSLWAARFENQAVLAFSLTPDSLYRSCVELGMALDRRLGAVQRAYRLALEAAPLA